MTPPRVPLEWRASELYAGSEATEGRLDGVQLVSIVWGNGGWRLYTGNMPSRYRPKPELRYVEADEARVAAEKFVARWLARMAGAAGWKVGEG